MMVERVVLRETITEPEISAVQRAGGERLGLTLLPREIIAGDQVKRHVDDVKRPLWKSGVFWVAHFLERQIVGGIEAGERIGITSGVGSAEIGADETVAVNGVQRKLVHVDEARKAPADE